ncbi:flagellar basal body rod protein FlgB [Kineobactrum sediminis]|uniref:Flagellar basal body rod protein FlgB n=1 Tax=Kineobactrum sediminis TaxID=1905677 RepID=A0A2N5Y6G6_9GAMM|nr:flagellar basal body rod protein FlgB [Kineobactrum sediminis]PLW83994.1 flagellar basal body rod protein FlgB [Kineobactrum sediminis]
MSFNLDNYFGVHQDALTLRSQRNTVIANNLANADTPGFKSRDMDFREALANAGTQVGSGTRLRVTDGQHLGAGPADQVTLKYRIPLQPSQDGNTVEADREQAAFAENSVRYQASLQFLTGRITSIISALKGGNN